MRGHAIATGPMARRQLLLRFCEPWLMAATLAGIAIAYPPAHGNQPAYLAMAAASLPLSAIALHLAHAYGLPAIGRFHTAIGPVLLGTSGVVGTMVLAAYLGKVGEQISRGTMLLWAAAAPLAILLLRGLVIRVHARDLAAGRGAERVVLVGGLATSLAFARHLDEHTYLGLRVVGLVGDDAAPPTHELPTAGLDRLVELVEQVQADRVIVCSGLGDRSMLSTTLEQLLPSAIPVDFAPSFDDLPVFCLGARDIAGRPLLSLTAPSLSESSRLLKWLEDRILGVLFLAIATPVMLLVAAAIKCCSPGPVFFAQERHGANGRVFRMLKFRSMHHAGGSAQPTAATPPASRVVRPTPTPLPAAVAEPTSPPPAAGDRHPEDFRQATANDPRIFALGRLLRQTSLDELPQLINVVRGDMSIVGPRPHPVRLNERFSQDLGELMRRHFMKPGITGLAQISGARGETRTIADMRRRVDFDLEYIRTWSLWLDLRIIALTLIKGFYNRQP
ncbi:MAG: exopolysaccharide biosynthesis polyprenyl glycosylphosphotransferase [Planctomycetes bacterium]|nr:exopolysaccharide biosynthesis polyprenyl glycosylphosphotransferase [Planctomycetota bacterium]